LLGIPYAVKDIFAARGGPTTWGNETLADRVIDADAGAVRRLKRAGGVLVAKLALSEFAGGGRPHAPGASMHGQGQNPWDRSRYSGGSSSGSGIAVALGLVPYALGTETGGSIVGPAAFSGVTGLRPTFGLMPRDGVMTLSWSLDKVGPLARTADDCATVVSALVGRGGFGPLSRAEVDGRLRGLRVAWSDAEVEEAAPSVRGRVLAAVEAFRRLAPRCIALEFPRDVAVIDPLELIVRVEGADELRALLRDPAFRMADARQLATLRSGLETPASEYFEATRRAIPAAQAAFAAMFRDVDVILSVSRALPAPALDGERPPRDATKLSDLYRAAANLAGVPGVSFPCGLDDDGLPVGLTLIGPPGSDALLLGVVAAFQRATDFHLARPPEVSAA